MINLFEVSNRDTEANAKNVLKIGNKHCKTISFFFFEQEDMNCYEAGV